MSVRSGWLPRWAGLTALLLFVAASFYGVLEVHSSTDTWIGLAGAQRIMTQPEFPTTDTFSFTFYGETWFNQNWLSHVYLYLLYEHIGPNWVIYGTWVLGWGVFTFLLLAVRLRCGSWLAATLAAALVAMASRDWLSARPATVQFFLLSASFLCLTALLAPGARRRWWPIVGLLLVFLAWPHAHGSFIFGYGLVGMLLGTWALAWLLKIKPTFSAYQAAGVVGVAIITGILGFVLSPYGIENYTHPFKVTGSEVFRQIGEWQPPTKNYGVFPPVYRFWYAMAVLVACPVITLMLIAADRIFRARSSTGPANAAPARFSFRPQHVQIGLFDVGCVVVGFAMVMFARRFAPLFYILATPALVSAILILGQYLSQSMRGYVRDVLVSAALVGAVFLGSHTWDRAHREIYEHYPPGIEANLLERVTRYAGSPKDEIEFIGRNKLNAKVLTDWKLAGPVMFFAPSAQVYIDGRSQQVYDEDHYLRYMWLVSGPPNDTERITEIAEADGTDTLLLAYWHSMRRLSNAFAKDSDWVAVLRGPTGVVVMRRGSETIRRVRQLQDAGELWWPDYPGALAGRGVVYAATNPVDLNEAIAWWLRAIDADITQIFYYAKTVINTYVRLGKPDAAVAFLQAQRARIEGNDELSAKARAQLSVTIKQAEQSLAQFRMRGRGRTP